MRLLLVDDHPVFLEGLAEALGRQADFELAGMVTSSAEAVACCERTRPDLVLLDLAMRGLDGLAVLKQLRQLEPAPRVLMLTSSDEAADAIAALDAGADGYITKAARYDELVEAIRAKRPDISMSSDFIVGFPGETDADFQATIDLIDQVDFDHSFSFVYSQRPGTPAAFLEDDVDMAVKKQRLALLQEKINQNARRFSEAMVGSVQPVLVEGASRKDESQMSGRTENNRVVNFAGPADLSGQIVPVEITEALPNSLRGRLTGAGMRES